MSSATLPTQIINVKDNNLKMLVMTKCNRISLSLPDEQTFIIISYGDDKVNSLPSG